MLGHFSGLGDGYATAFDLFRCSGGASSFTSGPSYFSIDGCKTNLANFNSTGSGDRDDWAWSSEAAAREVADGRAEQAVVCCWTGTGASIAANKVGGIRAALCGDGPTAEGARRWNDANVLALSLRLTTDELGREIVDAFLATQPDDDEQATIATVER